MYINTSGHIVAAPMAHFLALNSSRFLYSHDTCKLPVIGLDSIIKDDNMILSFRNINGKQLPFHESMNYYFRSPKLQHTCLYQFFQDMKFISYTQAQQQDIDEYECYPFTENHPCHSINLAVCRKRKCIPVFPWQWLGSTKNFTTSLKHPVSDIDPDYQIKEEYSYKFMLLFLPFRSNQDLLLRGSYQLRWQEASNNGLFSDSMIEIANNIQNIHNSLESTIPSNEIALDVGIEENENMIQEENHQTASDDYLANIAQFFLTPSQNEPSCLTEETTVIDPKFVGKIFEDRKFGIPVNLEVPNLNSVIQFEEPRTQNCESKQIAKSRRRFVSEYSTLNTLASQNLFLRREESEESQTLDRQLRNIVNATGTWQSIVVWGENAQLDKKQQTAFEILTATYVLTFYEEADEDEQNNDQEDFVMRKNGLCQLARRNIDSRTPLCLFVTGPAGSGKCKLAAEFHHSKLILTFLVSFQKQNC